MNEGVKSEVQGMNETFESRSETAVEKSDETVEDEVKEDKPEDEEIDEKEDEGEIDKGGDGEVDEEEEAPLEEIKEGTGEEEEPEPEEDEKDKIITGLRKKLDEKEAKEGPEPEPEKAPAEEPLAFETQEFLAEDEDLEDLVRDPKKLNEVFNNIYQLAVTDTRRILGEGVLRSIPDIVRASFDVMDKLKEMNKKFFKDNEDLKPFRKVVASVFEEVATENPGKDIMDLLPMVATESRGRLELHRKAITKGDLDGRKPPRLPSRKRRVTILEEKPNPNPLLNELEEMNKIIRR